MQVLVHAYFTSLSMRKLEVAVVGTVTALKTVRLTETHIHRTERHENAHEQ